MTLHKFTLLLVLAACPAFSQTVIMGHHLGESVSQFLAAEPGLQGMIDSCRVSEPKPMTPEQIHALSKHDVEALGAQVFATVLNSPDAKFQVKLKRLPTRGELEDLAKQGMPIVIDKRMPDVIATCHSLLELSASSPSSSVAVQSLPHTHPRPVIWHFTNGTLSEIDVDFQGGDFSEIAKDVTTKTGVGPDESKEVDTPNLYGALLHVYRKATWLTPELYALLEADQGALDAQIHLSVVTRMQYDVWKKAHLKQGSLD